MRVLVADKLASFVPDSLEQIGCEVEVDPVIEPTELGERLQALDPEVLVVRSTRVETEPIRVAPSLALIIRAGAGVNTIDLDTASAYGVYVANCPGRNSAAVAELTLAHLLNLDRRIADNVAELRARRWNKKEFGRARGLRGRTLAVLGCGRIGREVIHRAHAFGMRVVGWSPHLDEARAEELGVRAAPSPEEAVRDADAVSVHLALSADSHGIIGRSVFEAMKPGVLFVNTARGELVDPEALRWAADERGILAGLDVYPREPSGGQGQFDDPLVDHPNIYGTHHIGASTAEATEAVGREVVRIADAYRSGQPIPNCVNLADRTPASHVLAVRHADRVGVLANVLEALREAGHNVQEMQNVVFSGARAACARIAVVGEPSGETVARIEGYEDIYAVKVGSTEGAEGA